jgi:hypothetical protein
LGLGQFEEAHASFGKSKEKSIKWHKNSTTLVFQRDKITPTPYKIGGTRPIEVSNIQSINLHF